MVERHKKSPMPEIKHKAQVYISKGRKGGVTLLQVEARFMSSLTVSPETLCGHVCVIWGICLVFFLEQYADPVSDILDKWGAFRSRLFREACVFHKGNYVKDLSHLGRDLNKVIIIDNSPASYTFHPDNAVRFACRLARDAF